MRILLINYHKAVLRSFADTEGQLCFTFPDWTSLALWSLVCSSSVYVLRDTESDTERVGTNNVIMISKAFCNGLKNWIYPVVAPMDKQQVSVMAPASNV
jgi:hypothetical protein